MPASLAAYRMRGQDAPLDLIFDSADWHAVIGLINGWARQPLRPGCGYAPDELDAIGHRSGLRFPPLLREWWRLAGRHPLVRANVASVNSCLLGPEDCVRFSRGDFLMIALDDFQTESGNGILTNCLSHPDPEIFGVNTITTPCESPGLDWYKGKFIVTALRVPTLIFATLLSQLFDCGKALRDDAVHLVLEDDSLGPTLPDDRMKAELRLTRFANPTMIGYVYSDGVDVIYYWMRGFACRTELAAKRVSRVVPVRRREWDTS